MKPQPKPCRGCGAKMVMMDSALTKARLPAQRVRSVYIAVTDLLGNVELQKVELPNGELYISHFETCPNADDFSRKGKR